MDKKILNNLNEIANKLDEKGLLKEADVVTDVMTRVAQNLMGPAGLLGIGYTLDKYGKQYKDWFLDKGNKKDSEPQPNKLEQFTGIDFGSMKSPLMNNIFNSYSELNNFIENAKIFDYNDFKTNANSSIGLIITAYKDLLPPGQKDELQRFQNQTATKFENKLQFRDKFNNFIKSENQKYSQYDFMAAYLRSLEVAKSSLERPVSRQMLHKNKPTTPGLGDLRHYEAWESASGPKKEQKMRSPRPGLGD
jgi:hypothetical protein